MAPIVIDAAMRDKLLAAPDFVDFCDESGKILFRLRKVMGPEDWEAERAEDPPIAELDRRVREGKRYTTEQVLEMMKGWRNGR